MLWYAVEAHRLGQDEAYEAVSYDGGNDKSIDLFYVDEEFERVIIAQGKFNRKGTFKAKPGYLYEVIHSTDWLADPEALRREGREDLASAADDYSSAVARGYSIEYIFVYMGPPKRDVQESASQFNAQEAGNIPSRTARAISLDLLQHVHDEHIDKGTRIENDSISLLPGQAFRQTGAYGRALVATVAGSELRRLYVTHGDALFDRNVRLFLGARKGGVNAGIRETLESPSKRRNFWAYNNGLTLICDSFDLDEKNPDVVVLRNFSIVNGCQTTVSIANAQSAALDDVSVLARIVASPDEPVIDDVITYTNRQAPIQPWDISSQSKQQKRLKQELAKEPHPFFYILRRGETNQLTPAEKRRFTRDGKFQGIPHDQLAQYLAAFNGNPVIAYKDKSLLFTVHRGTAFPADLRAERLILTWMAGEAAENAVGSALKSALEKGELDKIRILKQGGKLFVLAALSLILRERNGANYLDKIKRDVVGSKNTRDRLLKYAELAVILYVQAARDTVANGAIFSKVLRSQDSYPRVQDKIRTYWEMQSMSKTWVEDVLPKL